MSQHLEVQPRTASSVPESISLSSLHRGKSSPALEALLHRLEELKSQKTELMKEIRQLEAEFLAAYAALHPNEPQSPDLADIALSILSGGTLAQADAGNNSSLKSLIVLMNKIADLKSQLANVEVEMKSILNEINQLQTEQESAESLLPSEDQRFKGFLDPNRESSSAEENRDLKNLIK